MPSFPASVLVVEDDPANRAVLRTACEGIRMTVFEAATGNDAVRQAIERHPDVVILDVGLPDISGLEVCRRLRAQQVTVPIVMVSGKADLLDVVVGIEVGADDYVRKPYNVRELLARIAAHLRRRGHSGPPPAANRIELPGLDIDLQGHRVRCDGDEVRLTLTEFNLLAMLASRRGETVSRTELLSTVWAHNLEVDSRTIDAHVHRLRRKLGERGAQPRFIETVQGVGYRFTLPAAELAAAG
jgi:DNA-binding response OmpR family regulator